MNAAFMLLTTAGTRGRASSEQLERAVKQHVEVILRAEPKHRYEEIRELLQLCRHLVFEESLD